MCKMKISVSTLLMLIVMSLFSMVAFAAAPDATTSLRATIDTNKSVKVFWSQVIGATSYKVYVDGTEVHQTANGTTVTYTYIAADTAAKQWNIEVSAVNADGEGAKVSYKLATGPAYNADFGKASTDKQNDNDITNANQSGGGVGGQAVNTGVLQSNNMVDNKGHKGAQRTHGEYQNNTNSCASCHQTHTAASKSLLFKDGVYSTCTACHDGTLGFYNVFGNGEQASSAGTFGGTHDGNMSVHMADGAVKMKAAPGGNPNGTGTWDKEFNCASCHAPHGSYSDRLLHYSPNGMGSSTPAEGGIKAGGYKAGTQVAVLDYAQKETGTTRFIGVKGTKAQHGLTEDKYPYNEIGDTDVVIMIYEKAPGKTTYSKTTNPWIYGYPTRGSSGNNHHYYTRFFTKDPATAGFVNANGTYPTAQAADVIDHYDYLADTAHIKYGYGLVWGAAGSDVSKATFAEVSRAYVVKLDLMPILDPTKDTTNIGKFDPGEELTFGGVKITTVNQRALYAGETNEFSTNIKDRWGVTTPGTDKVSGWGVAMSGYCSSCHTDYLASTSNKAAGTEGEGTWDKAFRHTTTSDSYTCVRCHFAHGTDVEVMTDAHLRNKAEVATDLKAYNPALTDDQAKTLANDYLLDKGASSALKRFTNMAVCWSCHTSSKAEQLKNTDSYKYMDGDTMYDPRGIPTTEGTTNWPKK
ncbi:cytochrome c3 family protein [Neobacillus sp. NPDC093182]|uniref:cytochrome c3 family protein n=1 Tax=Neobacillus sp. NPDC093182 TaxID=3364297 RepID=UPI0037FEF0DF